MKRSGLIALFLALVSVNFVSAAVYGSLSIGDALSAMDPSTMILGVIFIITALVINIGLSRAGPFKYNQTGSGIISISLALITIWGINRMDWDYYNFFNFFIPEGLIETIWPILFLLFLVLTLWKFGVRNSLLIFGAFLIAGSFFAYESGLLFFLGITFIVIWLLLWLKSKKKTDLREKYVPPPQGPRGEQGPPGQRGNQGPPGSSPRAPPSQPGKPPKEPSGPGFWGRNKDKVGNAWGKTKSGLGSAGRGAWGKAKGYAGSAKGGVSNKWQQRKAAKAQKATDKQAEAERNAKFDQSYKDKKAEREAADRKRAEEQAARTSQAQQQKTDEQARKQAEKEAADRKRAEKEQAQRLKIEQKQQQAQQLQIETAQAQEQRAKKEAEKQQAQEQKVEKNKAYWKKRTEKLQRIIFKLGQKDPNHPKIAKFNKELIRSIEEFRKN